MAQILTIQNYQSCNAGWVDDSLHPATKRRLYNELQKPISPRDRPGFIYVYQLIGNTQDVRGYDSSMYKIGRTSNIPRRLHEWSTRCGYTPHLTEYFPTFAPIRFSHRCERLIHIELAEQFGAGPIVCPGKCREAHYEWFCARGGPHKNGSLSLPSSGWTAIRSVILKWIGFFEGVSAAGSAAPVLVDLTLDDEYDDRTFAFSAARDEGDSDESESDDSDAFHSCNEDIDEEPVACDIMSETADLEKMLECLCLRDKTYTISQPTSSPHKRPSDLKSTSKDFPYYSDASCASGQSESDTEEWEDLVPIRSGPRSAVTSSCFM
ncbi:hypothetical protein PhCBS80983_g01398 [Powellomyces hirtus]|uniref:Bacteriophage T5 Orf172 DNA-binding domain-containing protein n=1 Tax=Powellomyces hirtus TaxID=109895 RepID=A0A507ED29_9FUNG|nr:hypothetical protein PhCBS80983_g01398 [Powellomyces hirtus]